MNKILDERLVASFERIATALEGLNDSSRTTIRKLWPERVAKEAVLSRVLTEEDRIREQQGATDNRSIEEWLSEPFDGDNEFIGEREKAFLKDKQRDAGPKTGEERGPSTRSSEEAGSPA